LDISRIGRRGRRRAHERWRARFVARWLNSTPPREGDTLATYLQNWHDTAPQKHQPLVRKIGDLFDVAIKER